MAISTLEFEIAMKKLGVSKRITQTNTPHTYQIGEAFLHCSNMEVVEIGKLSNKSQETIRQVIALEERQQEISDRKLLLQSSKVKTVIGLITVVLILQNRFSKELLEAMVNEVYQEVLSVPWIKQKVSDMFEYQQPYFGNEKFMELVQELNQTINPFADSRLSLKKPMEYLDQVKIGLCSFENCPYCKIAVETKSGCIKIYFSNATIKWILQYTKCSEKEEIEQIEIVHQVVFPIKTDLQGKRVTDRFCYGRTVEEELKILIKSRREIDERTMTENSLYISNELNFWRDTKSEQMIGYLAEGIEQLKSCVLKLLEK